MFEDYDSKYHDAISEIKEILRKDNDSIYLYNIGVKKKYSRFYFELLNGSKKKLGKNIYMKSEINMYSSLFIENGFSVQKVGNLWLMKL